MDGIITVALVTLLSLLLVYLWTKTRRDERLPPGPPTVPFIGNLNINTSDMLVEFRRFRQEYGDIFSLILGSQTVVVINGLDTLRELFIKNGDIVSERPDTFVFRDICQFEGIGGSSGALWKEHRTFALTTLRDFGFGKRSMEGKILEEVEYFVECVKKQNGRPFDIQGLIHTSVSNVICSVTFGRRYEHDDQQFTALTGAISDNLSNANVTGLLTFLPFLKYVPGDPVGYKKIMEKVNRVYGYINDIVDNSRKTFDENVITNYVDAYLKRQKGDGESDNSTFTDSQLKKSVSDLFVAGTETTGTAIRWFILFMLHYPDVQKRMREEIRKVVGDSRFPSLSDRDKMPYTDAVLHETLRMGNIAPLSVMHGLTQDLTLRGYLLPKNAILIPCLDSILNDPEIFANPTEFKPDRFLAEDSSLTGTEKIYTFGIGRRLCLGEALARMELFLFATSLIQRFQILPTEGEPLPSLSAYKMGSARAPHAYTFRAVECA